MNSGPNKNILLLQSYDIYLKHMYDTSETVHGINLLRQINSFPCQYLCVSPLDIRRMLWNYQGFITTSQWSLWIGRSSGLSLSCATKEPNTCGQPPMTSAGSSTTLWMWSGSCWPVWQLLHLSSQNVFCFVARSLPKQDRRGKASSVSEAWSWYVILDDISASVFQQKFIPVYSSRSCDVRIPSSCNKMTSPN